MKNNTRRYSSEGVKKAYEILRNKTIEKPKQERKDCFDTYALTMDVSVPEGFIDGNLEICNNGYTIKDLMDLYDSNVKRDKRLFWLTYDATIFIGIFTIDELIDRLDKDGYFDEDFWSFHKNKTQAIKDFEDYALNDQANIAYDMLWGVERII